MSKLLLWRLPAIWTLSLALLMTAAPANAQAPAPAEVDTAKATMRSLSESTVAGQFFPETNAPADLDAFRRAVLTIGNSARRDPNYRRDKGKKAAIDLSGDTTQTKEGIEKIYKDNPSPPYFKDLIFYKELNDACQYWAEYQASVQKGGHDAPGLTYNGESMADVGARFKYFTGFDATVAEGGAAPIDADGYPEAWLLTETHYRPWFNISGHTDAMGFGIAQSKVDGKWYGCKIVMLNDEAKVAQLTPAQTPDQPAASAPAEPPPPAAPAEPPPEAVAAFDEAKWYAIKMGELQMDIRNGGPDDNEPFLSTPGPYSGQRWKLRQQGAFYKLSTQFRGDDLCLGMTNEAEKPGKLKLLPCADEASQNWVLTSRIADAFGAEQYVLVTPMEGTNNCLGAPGQLGDSVTTGYCDAAEFGFFTEWGIIAFE